MAPLLVPSLDDFNITLSDEEEGTPWQNLKLMKVVVDNYIQSLDVLPHHYQMHFLHGAEIIGYKHGDSVIRSWWRQLYDRLVRDMHLQPETEEQLDERLGDNKEGWLKHADPATVD